MQYCRRCRAVIINPADKCPLCEGKLEGEAREGDELFPDTSRIRSGIAFGFRLFSYLCIVLVIVCITVNLIVPVGIFWAGYMAAAAACLWLFTVVAVTKRRNILKSIVWEVVMVSGIFLFWDYFTGYRGWSLDYVIPILILTGFLILTAVVKLAELPAAYYMVYFLLLCMAGLVPGIYTAADATDMEIPSIICTALSILILAGLVIFQGKSLWEEVKKKLHI